jgi:invasion protein IalB
MLDNTQAFFYRGENDMKLWKLLSLVSACFCISSYAQPAPATYGAWGVECATENGSQKCLATQIVATDPEGKNVAVGVIVEANAPGELPYITFRFSKMAYVAAGAGLKIDDNEPLRAPITGCDEAVCEVKAQLTENLSTQMRQGKVLIFAYFLDKEKQLSFPVSLDGFTQSLQAITAGKIQ